MSDLEIRTSRPDGGRTKYAVFDERGARLTAWNNKDMALESLKAARVRRNRAASQTLRLCMCCGREFRSEGIHNRLCNTCRYRSE